MNRIRYVEYDAKHTEDFVFHVPNGHDCFLLVLTHTPALFGRPDKLQEYPAGSAVLFAPHTPIYYKACGISYENDWCRFDSDEDYITSFPLQDTPFVLSDVEYCHNLFQLLTWKNSFQDNNINRIIDQLLILLFTELKDSVSASLCLDDVSFHRQRLLILRKSIYNNPQFHWNVPDMAKKLHLSEGYLQFIYKKNFGVSCMEDCINARIRLAKDQLVYTDKSVASIAEYCGYRSPEHFSRQFKRCIGESPLDFRKCTKH